MKPHLLTLRPPLHNGGHGFVKVEGTLSLWRCVTCHGYVPEWALREGFVTTLLGRWCSGLMAALPAGKEEP